MVSRHMLAVLSSVVFGALFLTAVSAFAQTDIYIKGSGKLFPIAVPQLCLQVGDTTANREIPRIIGRDLDLAGLFEILDPGTYIETPGKCGGIESVAWSDWSVIGAEGLVRGTLSWDGVKLRAQLYLYDVTRQKAVLGKEYEGDLSQVSRIAHKFANEIMRAFTGELGPFGTQIAFSSKVGRFKELFVMDMDGSNIRQLTNDRSLSMAASWSPTVDPTGQRLVYTSYRRRVPDLFEINVATRAVRQITNSSALEIGAKYARDGQAILVSLTSGGDSDIVLLGMDGAVIKKLTPPNGAIDVSADWSPDYSSIAFCSNRAGGPQIYVMNADGSGVRRISFATSNYCTSPKWSPKGDRIAFVCRAEGGFNVFTIKPDGSEALQLTSFGDNEDPSWSPDGRYLVFATTFGKGWVTSLALMKADGSGLRQLTSSRIGDSEPAWGPMFE